MVTEGRVRQTGPKITADSVCLSICKFMSAIGRVLCILFGACALARAGEIRTLTAKKACWLREKQNVGSKRLEKHGKNKSN